MNVLRQDLRKLSADRQTDKQTERHDRNYIPYRFTGGQLVKISPCYSQIQTATF